ncbi:MAG: hypothetical protein M1835_005521, partial [Candelina submexicana]
MSVMVTRSSKQNITTFQARTTAASVTVVANTPQTPPSPECLSSIWVNYGRQSLSNCLERELAFWTTD